MVETLQEQDATNTRRRGRRLAVKKTAFKMPDLSKYTGMHITQDTSLVTMVCEQSPKSDFESATQHALFYA